MCLDVHDLSGSRCKPMFVGSLFSDSIHVTRSFCVGRFVDHVWAKILKCNGSSQVGYILVAYRAVDTDLSSQAANGANGTLPLKRLVLLGGPPA